MRLPEITFGGVPDAVSPALERESAAAKGLTDTLQQGLRVYGQELVKTQAAQAQVDLSTSLDSIEQELHAKHAFSPDELRARLGDEGYQQIPEAYRLEGEQTVQATDPSTGQTVTQAKGIPTWQVAERLFQKQAQDALAKASQRITVGVGSGWQAQFQQAAQPELVNRWNRINAAAIEGMHNDLVQRQDVSWMRAARSGDFGMARAIVESEREIYGADGQTKRLQAIGGMEQAKPIEDPLIHFYTPGYDRAKVKGELEDAARRLADEKQSGLLSEERRVALSRRVDAVLKTLDDTAKDNDAAKLAVEIGLSKDVRDEKQPDLIDPAKAVDKLNARFQEGGDYAKRPEVRIAAGTALKKLIDEQNERAAFSFDRSAGTAWDEYNGMDAQGKLHQSFSNLTEQTVATLRAQGKKGGELIDKFKELDQRNLTQARTAANLPSPEESAKALSIEYALATNGKAMAAKGPGYMARLIVGGEGDAALGIPPGSVSPRDVPQLSSKFAAQAHPEKRKYLIQPETVAFEEAMNAFPTLKAAVQRRGNERGQLQVTEGVRDGVRLLSDKLAKFIDDNPGPDGRGPPQDKIREEARRLLGTVEVKGKIFGAAWPTKMPRVQAEAEGRPVIGEDGLQVPDGIKVPPEPVSGVERAPRSPPPAPASGGAVDRATAEAYVDRSLADGSLKLDGTVTRDQAVDMVTRGQWPRGPARKVPPPPPGTPKGWVPYRNGSTGEFRYNAPGKAKGEWKEAT